ncbi:helix-turn-helix domain-containing protein [Gracilibacillus xinjiangensis]|uniref:Helix-turn-helix domain-containing protein n=1 Tax=Gracilibacillus xinjiangensis TaxID=1193282 RepID=A0ABV8WXB1_9BACI
MDLFQVYTIRGSRLWPVAIYRKEQDGDLSRLHHLDEIKQALIENEEMGVSDYSPLGEHSTDNVMFYKKHTIGSIVGPVPFTPINQMSLDNVLSIKEAAEIWNLSDGNIIRKAIDRGNFQDGEVRKSGSTWLISYAGMQRMYEAVPETKEAEFPRLRVHKMEFDFEKGKMKPIALF